MKVLSPADAKVLLDAKDRRILQELIENPRQPLATIAKHVALSRPSVEYRIKKFAENSIVTGYRTVVNISKLGYQSYHVFINVQTPGDEKKLYEQALASPAVNALISYKGKYGAELSLMATSPKEFLQKYHEVIAGVEIVDDQPHIIVETVKAAVLPNITPKQKQQKEEEYTPDEKDILLLKLLSSDATLSNVVLGEKLGLSKDTVRYRIEKLRAARYIIEFRPAVNYDALGMTIHTVLLQLKHEKQQAAFEPYLRGQENVLWAAKTFGNFDYVLYVLTKDVHEFHALFNDLKQRFGEHMQSYELLYAYTQYKYSFMAENIALRKP